MKNTLASGTTDWTDEAECREMRFWICRRGGASSRFDGAVATIDPSVVSVLPIGVTYQSRVLTPDFAAHAVVLGPAFLDRCDLPLLHAPAQSRLVPNRHMLRHRIAFERLRATVGIDPMRDGELVLELVGVLMDCVRNALPAGRLSPHTRSAIRHTRAVRELICAEYASPLTLDEIAREVGLSPFHLARTFRAVAGVPIHQHLNRVRLGAALSRVLEGDTSLSRVAHATGFSSHSHFTYAFRRAFGITPTSARATLATGQGIENPRTIG